MSVYTSILNHSPVIADYSFPTQLDQATFLTHSRALLNRTVVTTYTRQPPSCMYIYEFAMVVMLCSLFVYKYLSMLDFFSKEFCSYLSSIYHQTDFSILPPANDTWLEFIRKSGAPIPTVLPASNSKCLMFLFPFFH